MPASFAAIFDQAREALESKGIEVESSLPKPAKEADLATFTRETGIELPASFASFYAGFSDGYLFTWEDGSVEIPTLQELAELRAQWLSDVSEFADDPTSMDECMEPENREAAFRIWQRMKSWLPFFGEESDHFCLDLESGHIVFNKHDWYDGFGKIAETNGLIVGNNLQDFLQNWARFSFESMWFGDYPHSAGETSIDWSAFEPED